MCAPSCWPASRSPAPRRRWPRAATPAGGYHADGRPAHPHGLIYDPDAVVRLDGYVGYQMMIRFGADERIENVAIGDGAGWQVTPNKAASLLFIKPLDRRRPDQHDRGHRSRRSYLFELDGHPEAAARAAARSPMSCASPIPRTAGHSDGRPAPAATA